MPKKIEVKEVEEATGDAQSEPKAILLPIAVDFPNEGLNNLARKINEIIDYINAR